MYYYSGDTMKIYLDLYFLINYILDISILIGTSKLLKRYVKFYRYLLGGLIGNFSIIVLFINLSNIELFIFKLFISLLMIIITFGFNNIFSNLFYFYIISIILGGFFYLIGFDNYSYNFIIITLISPFIIYIFIKDFLNNKRVSNNKYLVSIEYNNYSINTYGYIDTGNSLKDPYSNKSIILIDSNINIDKPIIVPFIALNNKGIIKCFKPDKLFINNREYSNYLVGVSNNKLNLYGSNCILPNSLLEVI